MSILPVPVDADQAMAMARAGLAWLAAADPTAMAAEAQARYLRLLEQSDAIATAARASILGAFAAGRGHDADGAYSPRAWLMHQTGVTKDAAAAHVAWARRLPAHPHVAAALATGELPESLARTLCSWIDQLPQACRDKAEEILVATALSGLGLWDLAALAGEILARACPQAVSGDGEDTGGGADEAFEDRGVRLETTFEGAGVLHGDLTTWCAALVGAVLEALSVRPARRTPGPGRSAATMAWPRRCAS